MAPVYRTLAVHRDLVAETEVRRSRFHAVLRRADDETAARRLIDEQRRTFRDAGHHCSAFIIGPSPSIERSNDDGEPSGTAGAPMLEVLRGHALSDVTAVVVRWFGGTKLGTGGLARAYADAVQQALAGEPLVTRHRHGLYDLLLPHSSAGRVEGDLRAQGVGVIDVDYGEEVRLRLATADPTTLGEQVAALTGGESVPVRVGETWVDSPI